jgi:hypothetical protein
MPQQMALCRRPCQSPSPIACSDGMLRWTLLHVFCGATYPLSLTPCNCTLYVVGALPSTVIRSGGLPHVDVSSTLFYRAGNNALRR